MYLRRQLSEKNPPGKRKFPFPGTTAALVQPFSTEGEGVCVCAVCGRRASPRAKDLVLTASLAQPPSPLGAFCPGMEDLTPAVVQASPLPLVLGCGAAFPVP